MTHSPLPPAGALGRFVARAALARVDEHVYIEAARPVLGKDELVCVASGASLENS